MQQFSQDYKHKNVPGLKGPYHAFKVKLLWLVALLRQSTNSISSNKK